MIAKVDSIIKRGWAITNGPPSKFVFKIYILRQTLIVAVGGFSLWQLAVW